MIRDLIIGQALFFLAACVLAFAGAPLLAALLPGGISMGLWFAAAWLWVRYE